MVEVVAALVCRGKEFLIAQRPQNKARGLLWEFVGGKVEPGETKEQALVRECVEELGVIVVPAGVYATVEHVYPDIAIRLTLFRATTKEEPIKKEHADLAWITPEEIDDYAFCPADEEILKKLKKEGV